jgi:3-oxoacyl-[acyl-carrier-protein] synthase II
MIGFGSAWGPPAGGQGLWRAARAALDEAGIGPEALDHVNAHGVSTPEGDIAEAAGLNALQGPGPPIRLFASRSYFGDLGAGAGVVELAASLLALRSGILPATLNYEDADPACPVVVTRTNSEITGPHFLKVSCNEMGQCAAAVFRSCSNA